MQPESEETGHPLCPQCCHPHEETLEVCEQCGFLLRASTLNSYHPTMRTGAGQEASPGDPPPPLPALASVWTWAFTLGITVITMIIVASNTARDPLVPVLISGAVAFGIGLMVRFIVRHFALKRN